MINLYDGNNVMRRAMERHQLPGARPLSIRQRFEHAAAAPAGTEIWVWDGRQHNDRRREIYPDYKMNRTPTPEDVFAQIRLWRELLVHSGATQVTVHGWEADDAIATLAKRFAKRGVPVSIHSNDMDYAQLDHFEAVTLVGVNTKGIPSRWVPLYKAMVGDTSDNIAGIKGFGHKRWEEMRDHWPQIERAVVAGDPAGFIGLPFKPAVLSWLTDEANVKLLQNMLLVTYFYDVPEDELTGGITEGRLDRLKAYGRMQEFFL